MPDEDERPRDASGGPDAGLPAAGRPGDLWAQVTAPDDISELAHDIQAYRREQRAARRQERFGRLGFGVSSAPLTLTVAALAIVAVAATLLTLMGPRPAGSPASLPLPNTTVADGAKGGLLPDVNLTDANNLTVAARALRPAVFAVLPPGCGCGDLVRAGAANAGRLNVSLYAVVPPGQTALGDSLNGQLKASAILSDTTGEIEKATAPSALTFVLVNRDGTIYSIEKGADSVTTGDLPANLEAMLGTTG